MNDFQPIKYATQKERQYIADEESYRMGWAYDYIDVNGLISKLKQIMKDECGKI